MFLLLLSDNGLNEVHEIGEVQIPLQKEVNVAYITEPSREQLYIIPTSEIEIAEDAVEPTITVANTPTTIPTIELKEGIYSTTLRGEKTLKDVQIETCTLPCSREQIEKQLLFDPKIWKAVVDGRVVYIHSGRFTYNPKDYEFGEIFRENYNNSTLIGTKLCFEESLCYSVIDYKVPDTEAVRVESSEIFPQQEINDYIIVTCVNPFDDNSLKLIMLVRLIN